MINVNKSNTTGKVRKGGKGSAKKKNNKKGKIKKSGKGK